MDTVKKPNTIYTEMEDLERDIVAIHNSVIDVANQLGFSLPMSETADGTGQVSETVRNKLRQIKELVSLTKDRALNLAENVK